MSLSFNSGKVLLKEMILKLRWKRPNKILVCVSHFLYLNLQCVSLNLLVSYNIACLKEKVIKVECDDHSFINKKKFGMMEDQLKWLKDVALVVVSLREKVDSLRAKLSGKAILTFFLTYYVIGLLHKLI